MHKTFYSPKNEFERDLTWTITDERIIYGKKDKEIELSTICDVKDTSRSIRIFGKRQRILAILSYRNEEERNAQEVVKYLESVCWKNTAERRKFENVEVPQEKKPIWLTKGRLTAIYAVLLIVTFLCAFLRLYDYGLIEDIERIEAESNTYETCCMPGCTNKSTVAYRHKVESAAKRHESISIPNKANCRIFSGINNYEKKGTYHEDEEYIIITPDGNGNYVGAVEEVEIEHTIVTDTYVKHYFMIKGEYCDEHAEEALAIIKDELKAAVCSNLLAFWGITVFPENVVVMSVIFFLCFYIIDRKQRLLYLTAEYDKGIKEDREGYRKYCEEKLEDSRPTVRGCRVFAVLAVVAILVAIVISWPQDIMLTIFVISGVVIYVACLVAACLGTELRWRKRTLRKLSEEE